MAQKLSTVLEKEAKVSRPTIKAEIKISGLDDDSVTSTEIELEVAEAGGCLSDNVKSSEIRWMRNGLGTAWVKCPLEAANKLAESGKLKIGWTIAKVELLKKRQLQCFNCWSFGHVGFSCTSTVCRKGHCYFCGLAGHTSHTCRAERPDCLLCKEKNLKSNHRLGSATCSALKDTAQNKLILRAKLPPKGDINTKTPERRLAESEMETDDVVI